MRATERIPQEHLRSETERTRTPPNHRSSDLRLRRTARPAISQDELVTAPDLHSAVEELYSSPAAEFTARRKALSASARSGGDRDLAVQIAALRKPTLSADTLNRLVRAAPEAVEELLDLGTALRSAEKALDAAALRELSGTRRSLVNDLAQLAFDITELAAPSSSTRDEVVATLNAALADEQVADRLMSGALVTQARWDGFGSTSLPELAAVIPMLRTRTPPADRTSTGREEPERPKPGTATPQSRAAERKADDRRTAQQQAADRAAVTRREAEDERVRRLEAARREADEAEQAAAAAAQEVADIDRRIGELGLQLAHQRELLAQAQRTARSTENRRRAAHLALTRSGGSASR